MYGWHVTERTVDVMDWILQNHEALRDVGRGEISKAHAAGVPAYYMDPSIAPGILREWPDGRIDQVEVDLRSGEIRTLEQVRPAPVEMAAISETVMQTHAGALTALAAHDRGDTIESAGMGEEGAR